MANIVGHFYLSRLSSLILASLNAFCAFLKYCLAFSLTIEKQTSAANKNKIEGPGTTINTNARTVNKVPSK